MEDWVAYYSELEAYLKIKVEELKVLFVIVVHKNENIRVSQREMRKKERF